MLLDDIYLCRTLHNSGRPTVKIVGLQQPRNDLGTKAASDRRPRLRVELGASCDAWASLLLDTLCTKGCTIAGTVNDYILWWR